MFAFVEENSSGFVHAEDTGVVLTAHSLVLDLLFRVVVVFLLSVNVHHNAVLIIELVFLRLALYYRGWRLFGYFLLQITILLIQFCIFNS